ncbi:tetratricopeptide repeat protein [Cytophagales bacterium RKSG123]|nr:tetratricopeptide repeat protein [Xanthovirga aplysinae]
MDPNEIVVKFFDDFKSKQWTTWVPHGEFNQPGGLFQQIYTTEEKRFNIQLAKSNLQNPQLLVSVMAHELAHVKLLGSNYVNRDEDDMEPLTDLTSIFYGFGVFVANSCQTQDIYWISRSGYLPNQVISYTNALICYITENDANKYYSQLNYNTKDLFKQDFEFLIKTNDTKLSKAKVLESESIYKLGKQIDNGFDKRNYDDVIEASKKLLEVSPNNIIAFNNIGYALLQQKKYQAAIDAFTKAIDIDPYWEYAYNNRGYCKLQLGEIEDAFADLHSSFEMNPDNSFSWRNLGAYYLKKNDLEKALKHFEQAEKIDPKTELINFYIGRTHSKIGNLEKAKQYLDKSKELNEYNDTPTE